MSETKCGGKKTWEFEGFAPEIFLNKKKNHDQKFHISSVSHCSEESVISAVKC